jgi:hypothetical protein
MDFIAGFGMKIHAWVLPAFGYAEEDFCRKDWR